jgi:hypothetical protein
MLIENFKGLIQRGSPLTGLPSIKEKTKQTITKKTKMTEVFHKTDEWEPFTSINSTL